MRRFNWRGSYPLNVKRKQRILASWSRQSRSGRNRVYISSRFAPIFCTLFELRNAPGTFQRMMDVIPASMRWKFALVNLDNIVIFSAALQEYVEHVCKVLMLVCDAGETLELKKCKPFTETIDYLRQRNLLKAPWSFISYSGRYTWIESSLQLHGALIFSEAEHRL